MQYIIGTIAKYTAYSQFMEPIEPDLEPEKMIRIIQNSVETIEYALRIENVMQVVNEDESQRKDLVTAIG